MSTPISDPSRKAKAPSLQSEEPSPLQKVPQSNLDWSAFVQGIVTWASTDPQGAVKVTGFVVVGFFALLGFLQMFGPSSALPDNGVGSGVALLQREAHDLRQQVDSVYQLSAGFKGISKLASNFEALEKGVDSFAAATTERQKSIEQKLSMYEKLSSDRHSMSQARYDELKREVKNLASSNHETFVQEVLSLERSVDQKFQEHSSAIKNIAADISLLSTELRKRKDHPFQNAQFESEPPEVRHPSRAYTHQAHDIFLGDADAEPEEFRQQNPMSQKRNTKGDTFSSESRSTLAMNLDSSAWNEGASDSAQSTHHDPWSTLESTFPKLKPTTIQVSPATDSQFAVLPDPPANADEPYGPSLFNVIKKGLISFSKRFDRPYIDQTMAHVADRLKLNKVEAPSKVDDSHQASHSKSQKKTQTPPLSEEPSGTRVVEGIKIRVLSEERETLKKNDEPTIWYKNGWDNMSLWLVIGLVTVTLWYPFLGLEKKD
ncbi:hypothetical protein HDU93_010087 [Gonapodya sp. JEL0774]|nr:hypothetical protein HDU93_010087 [Gonapodya sp. JEL0774]